MGTQNKNINKFTKSITNKHKMSITRALEDKKKSLWPKMKLGLHFYTLFLSLTLNSTSTSLDDNDCLGTLNLKLTQIDGNFMREPIQFSKIKNKK
jgi:hypothetical protein